MLLFKDGITIEVTNPIDVARYKRAGYEVVKAELPSPSAKPKTDKVEKPQKTDKKDGE